VKLEIDRSRCRGHAQCVAAAPHLIRLDADGKAELIPSVSGSEWIGEARDAELLCPEEALSFEA
jgi:ferredoxin